MNSTVNIVVKERSDDFHAAIKEDPGAWGNGSSPKEAIGDLILGHREYFPGLVLEGQLSIPQGK